MPDVAPRVVVRLLYLDELLPVYRRDFVITGSKAEGRRHALNILVNVKLLRCDDPEPVKWEPAMAEPKTKRRLFCATSTSLAYLLRSSHTIEALSVDGLFFSSPGPKICDQRQSLSQPLYPWQNQRPTCALRQSLLSTYWAGQEAIVGVDAVVITVTVWECRKFVADVAKPTQHAIVVRISGPSLPAVFKEWIAAFDELLEEHLGGCI
ncbi:hypothetical protein FPRO04_13700 [Fusarium proliferatum]|nr:hypothetical protein FPRO04_13700 [Fusarium proliferatum]